MSRIIGFLTFLFLGIVGAWAQITAPGAVAEEQTVYPVFGENDPIYVFCAADSGLNVASLRVEVSLAGTKTFRWEKYNPGTAAFEVEQEESSAAMFVQRDGLSDGCYRVTVMQGANSLVYRAWVFNNWLIAENEIVNSNCESFQLIGRYRTPVLTYYDLVSNQTVEIVKNVQLEWKEDNVKIGSLLNLTQYNPPASDKDYELTVSDRFGCVASSVVRYQSIVPKAAFSVDPMSGEAPLTVTFSNNSENGTPGQYEWIFYRDADDIADEAANSTGELDSIMLRAYDDSPIYTYESSGRYWVKLVAKHISDDYTCVDTAALDGYIVADTSFVLAPNVFTPNGDGVNDEFVIKFWSMKEIEINVYNRWGKRVHHWQSGNVQGFEESQSASVWDGRIGGRYASPGVYYYDVVGRGRDDRKRTASGFVHLFRDK